MTPKWYRFAWFLGRAPDLTQRQWRVLGLVAAVSFFETYDLYLFSLNLKQIQADLVIPESDLGFLGVLSSAQAPSSPFRLPCSRIVWGGGACSSSPSLPTHC